MTARLGAVDREGTLKKAEEIGQVKMPQPVGYKILITLPRIEEKIGEAGIILADTTKKAEEIASCLGFVLKLGELAYRDQDKFPNGPWCKEGDFIIMRNYSGTRFMVDGQEFRLINDDQVEAVVDDPRGYTRA
jgi:co-chaperonin GroES (HSP10)